MDIISLPSQSYWRQLAANLGNTLLQQIVDARIDILIEDAMVHPSLFWLNRRLRREFGIPVVALLHLLTSFDHHPGYSAWFYRTIERCYLQSVTGMIANSQTTLNQLSLMLPGLLPAHCLAVPAGDNFSTTDMDVAAIAQRALMPGPLRILLVGNVIRRKGLHVLIEALRQLPAEAYRLTVAGRLDMEPEYVIYIQQLIRAAQLQEQVILAGPQQDQDLADLYRDHQLMVLPSAYESYGIVYVEAQQFGLPVIGTTAGAAREIISHGDNGYLIDPEDPQDLAELLQNLHHDRRLLLQLSRNALAAYARQPKWEESCEIIRQFLWSLS